MVFIHFSKQLKQDIWLWVSTGLLGVFLLGMSGCQSVPLMGGVGAQGELIYLTPIRDIPKHIQECAELQDLSNEESKINYLIYRVQKSALPFTRNGSTYSSENAAQFLRWKLNRPNWRPLVRSAREFVIIITRGSSKSGLPYEVKLPDRTHHELKAIMINELDFLEEYLKTREAGSAAHLPVSSKKTEEESAQNLQPVPESDIHRRHSEPQPFRRPFVASPRFDDDDYGQTSSVSPAQQNRQQPRT
ncbi:MAG: hypothetical protein COV74_08205 [Candidatus Omnitrophica bacterium CG11_big_fil_rev_8_21_14_0_20_45_26]|uniref:Uncharacterized protein n=1 Tax=Candidatus Abzuiibacterium crystallinum TaxID=1974748 RepID=A0A2H0LM12_9BACT|nr:MAG: hypothetical protein COV74_08205 [Candidatus Omnitrophica bacterium CG11_big_fil_rev_8_21_14_0_20_45_26]PIW63643.1 MAG: hypothetical protein COW12_09090 [Candidatus Omnitrophica bacterium CG12_big_fil_rev_8_21_14_0_65_45_16]